MTDHAQRELDKLRRYKMLFAIHGARANQHGGWLTGRAILATFKFLGQDFQIDDRHAMDLLQDLVTAGYALEEDNRENKSQPFGLDHLTYKITDRGNRFMLREEPADPLIEDGRIVKQR